MNDIGTAFSGVLSYFMNLFNQTSYFGNFCLVLLGFGLVVAITNIVLYIIRNQ